MRCLQILRHSLIHVLCVSAVKGADKGSEGPASGCRSPGSRRDSQAEGQAGRFQMYGLASTTL